jgi:hypothetical protein
MKNGLIEKIVSGVLPKVFAGQGSCFFEKLNGDITVRCCDRNHG